MNYFYSSKKLNALQQCLKATHIRKNQSGITLVLIILIMTGVLTISLSVFDVVFGNFLLTGEVIHSYYALYADDRIIEKLLYLDRSGIAYDQTPSLNFNITLDESGGKQAQIEYVVDKSAGTIIEVRARYPATGTKSPVKRAFRVSY